MVARETLVIYDRLTDTNDRSGRVRLPVRKKNEKDSEW